MGKLHPRHARAGFTLLEIMIVILVISVLLMIAVPNFLRARDSSRGKACTKNLREIESAKEQWAMSNRADPTATPHASDIVNDYMRGSPGVLPNCPTGGTYDLNNMQSQPTCSIGSNGTSDNYDDHLITQ
jgi:prepilin-type N-terminal cleavage/methylation domain-containing protein